MRRSIALIPFQQRQRIAEALQWNPDAVCLDLGDQVSLAHRPEVSTELKGALNLVVEHGVQALIRVSMDEWAVDLESVVRPGLSALVVSGLRGPKDVVRLGDTLNTLEDGGGLTRGTVGLVAYLDHGKSLWFAREIARATARLQGLVLGMGDLAFDMLKEPEEVPFFTGPVPRFPVPEYVWGRMALIATEARVGLLGLLGTTIAPGHGEKGQFVAAAEVARQVGFKGAFTFHPEAVEACNQVFSHQ